MKQCQKAIEAEREKYKTVLETEFNENELICPTCKREYEPERQKELRDRFDKNKSEHLKKITSSGNYFKGEIDKCKINIAENEKQKKEWEDKIFGLQKSLKPLVDELEKLPESIDISDRPEVQEIQRQIAEKEAAMNKENSAEEIRRRLKDEGEDLQSQLTEVEKQLALAQKNVEIDDRIAELHTEQREVAKKVADQEKMLYLLEEFIRFKMDRVSDTINQKLDGICVKLFERQINGGVKECCELTYEGVPYGSLNSGHRIVAGLKIIKVLQEFYGIYLPVFTDNAESVNDFNLPQMDCQMITLSVTDDKELAVKTIE